MELTRADALREGEQVTAEHAAAERRHRQLERLRRDGDLGGAGGEPAVGGQSEQVAPAEHRRADDQHTAAHGRDAVAGGDPGARRQRGDRHLGRAVGADRLGQVGGWGAPLAAVLDQQIDPTRVADREHGGMDPARDRQLRAAEAHGEHGDADGEAERGADDEQLDDREHVPDDEGGHRSGGDGPTLASRHSLRLG